MRFEHIVLLIIAFNVVSAVLQRRAKKAREKALRESGGTPADPEGAWDEDEEEEEQPARRPARREPAATRPSSPAESGDGPMRQPSFAQDILDQIMRDLGLKPNPVPPPPPSPSSPAPQRAEAPAPSSRETMARETVLRDARAAREDENARRERLERRERELEAESLRAREKIREWERLASSRTRLSGEARPAPNIRPVAQAGVRGPVTVPRASGAVTRPDLRDPRRLREAFVIKEILDAPLARRPRR